MQNLTGQISLPFFIVCRIFLSYLTLCNSSSFLHDRPNRPSPSFSSSTFQNFQGISDLLPEVSQFQHHKMLCSKCSTSIVSFLNLSPVCYWKESSSCWMLIFFASPVFNFTCTYILHNLLSLYPNSWNIPHSPVVPDLSQSDCGWLSSDSHFLFFFTHSFPFHSSYSFSYSISHAL